MINEKKEILIDEISNRHVYNVKLWVKNIEKPLSVKNMKIIKSINTDGLIYFETNEYGIDHLNVADCRLYLRSMSSMTEKEREEYNKLHEELKEGKIRDSKFSDYNKWLYSHHFDYNDLIEKGLAIEAPKGMYWYL